MALSRHGRAPVWGAAAAAVLLSIGATGCGDDDDGASAGPESSVAVNDLAGDDLYFDDDAFIGQTVTVSATVTEVLSPRAFVLAAGDWGDDNVLVLSGPDVRDVNEDDVVQVTGVVRGFVYEDYADDYGLADPGVYGDYLDEEFLEATEIERLDSTVTSITPTPEGSVSPAPSG